MCPGISQNPRREMKPWIGGSDQTRTDQEGAPSVAGNELPPLEGEYGSDPSVVGATYQINGHSFTMIGVAAQDFMERSWLEEACRISGLH